MEKIAKDAIEEKGNNWEERHVTFKYKISDLVKLKPFKEGAATIVPPAHDRYRVEGRAFAEGYDPGTHVIQSSIIYYCLRVGTLDRKKVLTFNQGDIEPYVEPKKD